MDQEEIDHLRKLRNSYLKRLRVLQLRQAEQGLETPPSVITEIEDLSKKISDIDSRLPKTTTEIAYYAEKTQVEVIVKGDINRVTPEKQFLMQGLLAAVMEVPVEQVTILKILAGSIIYLLRVPKSGAAKLLQRQDELAEAGTLSVHAIADSTIIWLLLSQIDHLERELYDARELAPTANYVGALGSAARLAALSVAGGLLFGPLGALAGMGLSTGLSALTSYLAYRRIIKTRDDYILKAALLERLYKELGEAIALHRDEVVIPSPKLLE